jgi:hypothetical protein
MEVPAHPVALRLEGQAVMDGRPVTRPVVPAEDMMQAFLWRHLVPSQDFLVYVRPSQWGPIRIEPEATQPVPIPAGGSATIYYKSPGWRVPLVEMKVAEPEEGLTVTGFESTADFISCTVQADEHSPEAGNLVVEGIVVWPRSEEDRKKNPDAPDPKPSSIGILPAVPYNTVEG